MGGEIVGIDGTGEQAEEAKFLRLSFLAQNVLLYVLNQDSPIYSKEDPREEWRMEVCSGALGFLGDAGAGRERVLSQNLSLRYLSQTRAYGLFLQAFSLTERGKRAREENNLDSVSGMVLKNFGEAVRRLREGEPVDQGET